MWKDINEVYEVSCNGEVRNKKSQRILKPFTMGLYHGVHLGYGNKHYIHKLVANAFLDNPDNKPVIDHIDRNRYNNNLDNLRWVSIKENTLNRSLETKPRVCNRTGEHHIKVYKAKRQVNPSYIVSINTKLFGKYYKCFRNMEEAIKYRDEILNALPPYEEER